LGRAGVDRRPATEVRLTGEGVPYQLDGDPSGYLPVTARASDERLFVMPPGREKQ
jgi:diacylglycerol kinase family enzyme